MPSTHPCLTPPTLPRSQVVVRDGAPLDARPPPYEELDYVPAAIRSGEVPVFSVDYAPDGLALVHMTIGRALAAAQLNGDGGGGGGGGQKGSGAAAAAAAADGDGGGE